MGFNGVSLRAGVNPLQQPLPNGDSLEISLRFSVAVSTHVHGHSVSVAQTIECVVSDAELIGLIPRECMSSRKHSMQCESLWTSVCQMHKGA